MAQNNTAHQGQNAKDQKEQCILQLSHPDVFLILRLRHHHRNGEGVIA